MLVLTRKLMEKLFIGDDICVTVVRLEGGQVRLGIEAPRDITVVRAELVPERQYAPPRGHGDVRQSAATPPHLNPSAGAPTPSAVPAANGEDRVGDVRIPQASAHGIDSRRRGRFR